MPSSESRIKVKRANDIMIVEFVDRNILDESNIQMIRDEISGLVDASPSPRLVVSFQGVEHLSSAALGALISINNQIRQRTGQLRLAHIDPQIYEVFKITQLTKIFSIHQTTDEAVKSLS